MAPKTPEAEFIAELQSALETFAPEVAASHVEKLALHYSLLRSWNERLNLTRIVEPREAARLHFAESLFGAKLLDNARSVLDIGSGAGFPAIPMAIVCADVKITAVESNQKKAVFLKEVKESLALANFEVVRTRIEDHDISAYDLITMRALDRAQKIAIEIAGRLGQDQRLMLFCTESLVEAVMVRIARSFKIEEHPVPESRERLVALLSPGET